MTETIRVHATTEIGAIRAVLMCFANPWPVDVDAEAPPADFVDEALIHQMKRNPHRSYDAGRVHEQQRQLVQLFEKQGTRVLLAEKLGDCVTQHYTRDIGFVIDDVFFVARPRRPYRRRELEGVRSLLPLLGTVAHLEKGFIEGGDVLLDRDRVIVGHGEETDADGVDSLRWALEQQGIEREVCELRFQDRGVIHLDTTFNLVAPELALVDRRAFDVKSLAWIEHNFEVVDATPEESQRMEINTLVIGEKRVVMRECSHRLANELAKRGLAPVLLDYSEVTALPGSFRCTTLPLGRAEPGEPC